jgi:hypothetical protein
MNPDSYCSRLVAICLGWLLGVRSCSCLVSPSVGRLCLDRVPDPAFQGVHKDFGCSQISTERE